MVATELDEFGPFQTKERGAGRTTIQQHRSQRKLKDMESKEPASSAGRRTGAELALIISQKHPRVSTAK